MYIHLHHFKLLFSLQKVPLDSDDSLNMIQIESKPTVRFVYIDASNNINLNMSRYIFISEKTSTCQ